MVMWEVRVVNAELHKRYVDDANVRAASFLLSYHSLSHFTTTLDLHFLQVPEALQVLDIFLDAHVSNLQDSGQLRRTLYIITGRGMHSMGGRARLRPAVTHHLKEKGLR
ncbi:hypothetical protein PR048_014517 [Dryococelus australis]|uniref:Smr domain-containing protein n=1 Tax=Dryococelus australis TaxID=614101 RepID=A0ABQ9HEE8_9NEOP|nr:hypothetical protein PR048_014517 [Dryococelus australis]